MSAQTFYLTRHYKNLHNPGKKVKSIRIYCRLVSRNSPLHLIIFKIQLAILAIIAS